MKKFYLVALSMLCFCSMITSCSNEAMEEGQEETKGIMLSAKLNKVNDIANHFGITLFKEVSKHQSDNFVISPLSIEANLALVANGAEGETLNEIVRTLGFSSVNMDDVNTYYNTMMKELAKVDNEVTFDMNNSVWAGNGIELQSGFKKNVADYYKADLFNVDFTTDNAKNQINSWVEEKTNNLITNLVRSTEGWNASLINTLYFKARWNTPFYLEENAKDAFYNEDGTVANINMMMIEEKPLNYFDGDKYDIISMPYANGKFVFDIILPEKNYGMKSLIDNLDESILLGKDDYTNEKASIIMPPFTNNTDTNMEGVLSTMGIKSLFSGSANLSKMTASPLNSLNIKQECKLIVNENGTEGAGATISYAPIYNENYFMMIANRPFIYIIREQSTGAILFIGQVVKM